MTTTPNLWRPAFRDNATDPNNQFDPQVAATDQNQFFVVWVDQQNFNLGNSAIVARRFDANGNPLNANDVLLGDGFNNIGFELNGPAPVRLPIANQADGLAVAFHLDVPGAPGLVDIVGLQRFDSTFQVIQTTAISAAATFPSITSLPNSGLIVAYTFAFGGGITGIVANTVSPAGVVGPPVTLSDGFLLCDDSALATLANGNVVAVFDNGANIAAGD